MSISFHSIFKTTNFKMLSLLLIEFFFLQRTFLFVIKWFFFKYLKHFLFRFKRCCTWKEKRFKTYCVRIRLIDRAFLMLIIVATIIINDRLFVIIFLMTTRKKKFITNFSFIRDDVMFCLTFNCANKFVRIFTINYMSQIIFKSFDNKSTKMIINHFFE